MPIPGRKARASVRPCELHSWLSAINPQEMGCGAVLLCQTEQTRPTSATSRGVPRTSRAPHPFFPALAPCWSRRPHERTFEHDHEQSSYTSLKDTKKAAPLGGFHSLLGVHHPGGLPGAAPTVEGSWLSRSPAMTTISKPSARRPAVPVCSTGDANSLLER